MFQNIPKAVEDPLSPAVPLSTIANQAKCTGLYFLIQSIDRCLKMAHTLAISWGFFDA
jgi:hypothetical protein